jgi:hypothetical protein
MNHGQNSPASAFFNSLLEHDPEPKVGEAKSV